MLLLANLVRTVAGVIVAILVLAILLVVLGANQSNDIVNWIHDAGAWLAGPFKGLFSFKDAKLEVAVNWGIAAVVYSVVAGLLMRLVASSASIGAGSSPTSRRV
jgi:uncharacterized Tic20 family protein